MKIQISDVMKSALHARCGERYIVQERGEIDIYVSLFIFVTFWFLQTIIKRYF